jgi:MFS family permease
VSEDQLPEANALLQTVENLSWAVGPVLGGILTAAAGPHAAYWINAVSFLISALLVARIPKRLLQTKTALTRGHWRDLADGFVVVVRSRPLLAVLVCWGVASLGIGAISLSEIFLAKNTLHAGDFGYGLLYGGVGIGLVLGSWWSSTVVERIGTARAYTGALLLMAVGFGAGAAAPNVWVAAACCVVGGIGDGVAIVCNALLVQRGAADHIRGRALTLVMSVTYVLNGAGTVVAGIALHVTSSRWIWAGGAASFALGGVAALGLLRERHTVGAEVAAGTD